MGFGKGARRVKIVGTNMTYYNEYTTTTLYVELAFGGNVNTLSIINDSGVDIVQISYDGATLDGVIKAGESLEIHTSDKTSVYIKATAGGDTIRIWGW